MRRLRARRAAGLAPAPDGVVRDPEHLLLPAVEATLAALPLLPSDAGLAALARRHAQLIDRASDQAVALRWHGPRLLTVLTSLHATPMSRALAYRQTDVKSR
jgi:hypothetical protein